MDSLPKHSRAWTFALLLFAAAHSAWAMDSTRVTIMETTRDVRSFRPCSRSYPEGITAFWRASITDANEIDARIDSAWRHALPATDPFSESPSRIRMQILGIVIGGDSLIYVNGFPAQDAPSPKTRSHRIFLVCDGGRAFWGAIWNPKTKTFSSFEFNGYA